MNVHTCSATFPLASSVCGWEWAGYDTDHNVSRGGQLPWGGLVIVWQVSGDFLPDALAEHLWMWEVSSVVEMETLWPPPPPPLLRF